MIYLMTFVFIFDLFNDFCIYFYNLYNDFCIYFYDLFNDAFSSSVQGHTYPGRQKFCPVATDILWGLQYGTYFMTSIWRVEF
jgi:hypothetical protein